MSSFGTGVPLRIPLAPAGGAPQLAYGGGRVLASVQVFTVFWGAAWAQPAQSGLVDQVNQFFDAILTSTLIDVLAEYSVQGTGSPPIGVPAQVIGHGKRYGTTTLLGTEPGGGAGLVSDAQIQTALQSWIKAEYAPQMPQDTVFFIYLPPDVTVSSFLGTSCQQVCGYHSFISGTDPEIYYAVIPYPGCSGCLPGDVTPTLFEALTVISSHALCEAITDPRPWAGWYDSVNGEIGDVCAWVTGTVGGYTVQRQWSNLQAACVHAPSKTGWLWADQGSPPTAAYQAIVGAVTVTDGPNAPQRPYVFILGGEPGGLLSTLWVNWWDGKTWRWKNQGAPPAPYSVIPVGAATITDPDSSQHPYAVVCAGEEDLWANCWDGAGWKWLDLGRPTDPNVFIYIFISGTAVVAVDVPNGPQRLDSFVPVSTLGTLAKAVWRNSWDGVKSSWQSLGAPAGLTDFRIGAALTARDAPNQAEKEFLFVVGSDLHLWADEWTPQTQWTWTDHGTPPGVTVNQIVGAVTVADTPGAAERPYVFVIDGDKRLWVRFWDGKTTWKWSSRGLPPGVNGVYGVGAVTVSDDPNAPQRPYAFVAGDASAGTDGNLWSHWWDGKNWQWSNRRTPPGRRFGLGGTIVTVKDVPAAAQRPYVFIGTDDDQLWVNYLSS